MGEKGELTGGGGGGADLIGGSEDSEGSLSLQSVCQSGHLDQSDQRAVVGVRRQHVHHVARRG